MNFFTQLAEAGLSDITLRIMQKGEKVTVNVLPGSITSETKPLNFTGTPEELDATFFQHIMVGVMEVQGIQSNIDQVKEELQKEAKEKKPSDKKAASASKKKADPKKDKPAKEEKTVTEEPKLFEE